VPKRTNTFQDVVAIVQRHMAAGATVEESEMVTPTHGGKPREVDVVVTSHVAGHIVRVAVEASKTCRRANVEWVERMIGKHADLPIDKLVLYSGSGFTKTALDKATAHNIAAIAAVEMTDEERESAVLGGLRSIWPKRYSLKPQSARVWVERSGGAKWFRAAPDIALFTDDGTQLDRGLQAAVVNHLRNQSVEIAEQIGLRDIAESMESEFVIVWAPVFVPVDDGEVEVFVRYHDASPPELHRVVKVEIRGDAVIEVARVDLVHLQLGDVAVSYGEVDLGGKKGVFVATGKEQEGAMTLRIANLNK
jgi:hypothetical protein